jgi:uncharacterized iron-regulated membrane protein
MKAKITRLLYSWHKWTGIVGGAFLLVILATGTAAVFKNEIDWLVTPALRIEPIGEKLSLDARLAAVEAAYRDVRVNSFSISQDDETADVFALGDTEETRKTVFVDPYTSEITGERAGETLANVIRQTHVRFYFFGANGRIAVGVFGIVLLISSITGLIIYFPFIRVVFRQGLRFWQLRDGTRAWNADLHKLVGIVTLVFNLILGATGAVLGLENLAQYYKPLQSAIHAQPDKALKPESTAGRASLDAAAFGAGDALPGFEAKRIVLPRENKNHFVLYGNVDGRFERGGASFVVADTQSGIALQTHSAATVSTGVWLYNLNEPLHFGDFAGVWMKIVYFLFGLTGSGLAVTGFVILYLRKRGRKRVTAARPVAKEKPRAQIAFDQS